MAEKSRKSHEVVEEIVPTSREVGEAAVEPQSFAEVPICTRCWKIAGKTVTVGRYTFCASCLAGWEALSGHRASDFDPELLAAQHVPPVATAPVSEA